MVRQKEIAPTIGIICAANVLTTFSVQAPAMCSFVIAKKGPKPPVYYFLAFGAGSGAGINAQASAASWR